MYRSLSRVSLVASLLAAFLLGLFLLASDDGVHLPGEESHIIGPILILAAPLLGLIGLLLGLVGLAGSRSNGRRGTAASAIGLLLGVAVLGGVIYLYRSFGR